MNKIIGLVGQMASGKGTAAKHLVEHHGASSARFSTVLRDVLVRLGLPVDREHMQTLSTALRHNFSEDILARIMADDLRSAKTSVTVIDGIRRLADIAYLKDLPGFHLVRIVADPKVRYRRLIERNENPGDAEKSYGQFLADEGREADAEIPSVMALASHELPNNGTKEEFMAAIDKLIAELNVPKL